MFSCGATFERAQCCGQGVHSPSLLSRRPSSHRHADVAVDTCGVFTLTHSKVPLAAIMAVRHSVLRHSVLHTKGFAGGVANKLQATCLGTAGLTLGIDH